MTAKPAIQMIFPALTTARFSAIPMPAFLLSVSLLAMGGCSSDPPRTEEKAGTYLRDVFLKLDGRRVSLNRQEGTDTVTVFLQRDGGEWSICQVGRDFVRFCHNEREDAMVLPLTDLHLIDTGPPAAD